MRMSKYPHGVPSWVDLATPDPHAAKDFYEAVFGWRYEDRDTGEPDVPYTLALQDDAVAAGIMLLSEQMAAAGMPPVWSSYVNVDDVDRAVAAVDSGGGAVLQPAMDVMDAGRMAVVADPAGAVIGMWQAGEQNGADVVNEHGAFIWNELITPDPAAVADFYEAVFGWTTQTVPMDSGEYTLFLAAEGDPNGIAGAMAPPMPGMPTFWGVYFCVDDVDAAVATARGRGAQVMMEPTAMPGVGTLAALVDPQGAAFSLMVPEAT